MVIRIELEDPKTFHTCFCNNSYNLRDYFLNIFGYDQAVHLVLPKGSSKDLHKKITQVIHVAATQEDCPYNFKVLEDMW